MSNANADSALALSIRASTARALSTMAEALMLTGDTDLSSLLSTISIVISADLVPIANEATQWLARAARKKMARDETMAKVGRFAVPAPIAQPEVSSPPSILVDGPWLEDEDDTTIVGKTN